MDIRRLRNFLGLSQNDVSAATGISVGRLSGAENRRLFLNPTEMRSLEEFYKARMRMLAEAKRRGLE
jgi:transcriptional regulator with XRE-family HTH domain